MFRTKGFSLAAIVALVICILAAAGYSVQRKLTDDQQVASMNLRGGGHHLDQNYNQLRYSKTTDFGATWTTAQAGDISGVGPYDETLLANFSAVVMNNGELCYLIPLLTGATPGIYAVPGPSFTPVLVMAQGGNHFNIGDYNGGGGRTDISRAPNGSLVGCFVGLTPDSTTTLWACKSSDNGATWTSWVIAAEPNIPDFATADAGRYHLPDRIHSQWAWVIYQDPTAVGFEMKTIRFDHTTTNLGTVVPINDYAGHPFSFMFAGTKPLAYDVAHNNLYVCFRNHDAHGVLVYYSNDAGLTWQLGTEVNDLNHRYPSVAMQPGEAASTPYLVYGETVGSYLPGDQQCLFMTYDELGSGGGSWIDPTVAYQCQTLFDENTSYYNAIYVPSMWWWDGTHGVSGFSAATNFLAGEVVMTDRTTDGGATWIDMGIRAHYISDQINASTMQIPELCGGENGVAYMVFSGAHGITDEIAPTVGAPELLTPATDPDGPYVVRAYYNDNVAIKIDDPVNRGPWVNWGNHTGVTVAFVNQDSSQADPTTHNGWYYFTIPDTALGGISQGDSIFFYCDGHDEALIYANSIEEIIVAGVTWLDIYRPSNGRVTDYALNQNYPNPFNPSTAISFDLPKDEQVSLRVFNTLGQEVQTLLSNEKMGAGTHRITFRGADLPSGVYLYQLSAGSFSETRKMMLVK